jgi:iron complex outermembrane recepter protein
MSAIVKLPAAAEPKQRCYRPSKLSLAVAAALYGAAAVYGVPAVGAPAGASDTGSLEEIVVTARKRTENLQDVPQSIDVFTSKDLQNLGISQFEDYATKTPSVSFISIGPGTQMFYMRGVSDGSNPNVVNTSSTGFYVDDMSMSFYGSIPDLHTNPADLERIEILNGPQGTLFGAGAMSGAIRIITKKPDVNELDAGVDVDGGKVQSGSTNTTYEGYLNLPIVEGRTAVRLSVYAQHQGGFINNLLTTRDWVNGVTSTNAEWARKNYNTQNVDGGTAAIKQIFNEDWSLVFSSLYQSQRHAGAWDQDPDNYGDRNVSRFGPENGNNYVRGFDFHVDGDVGIGDLVYAGTYQQQTIHTVDEYSNYVQNSTSTSFDAGLIQSFACTTGPVVAGDTTPFGGCKVPTLYFVYDNNTQQWSNELRLQSKGNGPFHWLVGAYWQKTKELYSSFYAMPNLQLNGDAAQSYLNFYNTYYGPPDATPLPGEWYSSKSRYDQLETTEFTDLTYDLTDRWSFNAGVQHFQQSFTGSDQYAGYFWNAKVPSTDNGSSHKFNAKAGLNFKVDKNLLLYADFAQGYRPGGVNEGLSQSCYANGTPQTYTPDTLNNFEVGWKSTTLGGRLTWDGAMYYMKWQDYQTPVYILNICPTTFNANLGDARIYGVESNIDYKIVEGLTVQASGSYNDSRLQTNTYENENFVVVPGERLPYVPYFSYSANVRYEHPITPSYSGYVQYDIAHKGDMWSDLRVTNASGFARSLQPDYSISNLRFGIKVPDEHWSAEVYITNLFDKDAVIFTNTGNYDNRQTTNEPRVFGLHLSYRWGKDK